MQVSSWPVNPKAPPDDPSETKIAEGPVLFVRFSLDGTILAVQRTGQEVEFISAESGVLFRQRCKHGTDLILGLFWTACPTCDVVFVTSRFISFGQLRIRTRFAAAISSNSYHHRLSSFRVLLQWIGVVHGFQ